MKTNIEISNIKNHFLFENEENEENEKQYKNEENTKYVSKIKNYCFSSINEANICDIIQKIPYYSNTYSILEDYDFINISQLHEKIIKKLEINEINENNKYLLF